MNVNLTNFNQPYHYPIVFTPESPIIIPEPESSEPESPIITPEPIDNAFVLPESFPTSIDVVKSCTVCIEREVDQIILKLGCEHTICNVCLRKLKILTCPVCREPINVKLVRKMK